MYLILTASGYGREVGQLLMYESAQGRLVVVAERGGQWNISAVDREKVGSRSAAGALRTRDWAAPGCEDARFHVAVAWPCEWRSASWWWRDRNAMPTSVAARKQRRRDRQTACYARGREPIGGRDVYQPYPEVQRLYRSGVVRDYEHQRMLARLNKAGT